MAPTTGMKEKRMRQERTKHAPLLAGCLLGLAVVALAVWTSWAPPARAAQDVSGALTAQAGTGGVTTQRFVKLSSSGTLPVIATATAVTDSVVGVCEKTADEDAMTRYAPIGTIATVDSGEVIAIGSLLTAGASGKAYVLDTDDASTQRIAGVALTADAAGTSTVEVLIVAGTAEQHQALSSPVLTTPQINDTSSDHQYVVAVNELAADRTVTLPLLTGNDTFAFNAFAATLTNKTIDGDDNTVQDLSPTSQQVQTSNLSGVFLLEFDVDASGSASTYTVPTGKKLRVLDAWGWKKTANGAHADDDIDVTDGSNAIFATEELLGVNEKIRFAFDSIEVSHRDLAAAEVLTVTGSENGAGQGDALVEVLCCWVTP